MTIGRLESHVAAGSAIIGWLKLKYWKSLQYTMVKSCSIAVSYDYIWRNSRTIAIFLKPEKDPSQAKSFRPITVVPSLQIVWEAYPEPTLPIHRTTSNQ